MKPPEYEQPNEKRPPKGAQEKSLDAGQESNTEIVAHDTEQDNTKKAESSAKQSREARSEWRFKSSNPRLKAYLSQSLGTAHHLPPYRIMRAAHQTVPPDKAKHATPPVLAPEAFHGPAGEIVLAIEQQVEPQASGILLQLLCALGNLIGPGPVVEIAGDRHPLVFFVALVGRSGKSRKGTSWGIAKMLLREVDAVWTNNNIVSGLSTGEGLIKALRDSAPNGDWEGVEDKRRLFVQDEFAEVLAKSKRDNNTLSTTLRTIWGEGNVQNLTASSPEKVTGAHVSIIAHITQEELLAVFPKNDAYNGFGNRFLWCAATRARNIPLGRRLDMAGLEPYFEALRKAVEFGKEPRSMTFSPDAERLWVQLYDDLSEDGSGIVGALTDRGDAYVRRLSSLYAVLDCSPLVEVVHLKAAFALWQYCEATVAHVWTGQATSTEARKILDALRQSPYCLSRTEVSGLFSRNKAVAKLDAAIEELVNLELIAVETRPTPGKKLTVYHALYVDDASQGAASSSSSSSSYGSPTQPAQQAKEEDSQ